MRWLPTISGLASRLYVRKKINTFRSELNTFRSELNTFRSELDMLRSKLDVPDQLFDQFQEDRVSQKYQGVYCQPFPLVSVCIATYNRADLLANRALKSVLNQTYTNIEVVVVGDCCTDSTQEQIARLKDNRITFINLPKRGDYPQESQWRWMVAGTAPINLALERARGEFICHLDDDDEFLPERIEKLLQFIQKTQADLVWHPFFYEEREGRWEVNEALEFRLGQVTTSSVFYHKWFKQIPWDMNAYKYREPGDWNRFRKIKYLGAKLVRYDEPLLRHYNERQQLGI